MSQFTNKADVITGGSSGIGLAVAREPINSLIVIPPRDAAMARVQRLHREAGELAENAPHIIADASAAHGLEQALIHAVLDCLVEGRVDEE